MPKVLTDVLARIETVRGRLRREPIGGSRLIR
jgi:hypothetical protein